MRKAVKSIIVLDEKRNREGKKLSRIPWEIVVPVVVLLLFIAGMFWRFFTLSDVQKPLWGAFTGSFIGFVSSLVLAVAIYYQNRLSKQKEENKQFVKVQPVFSIQFRYDPTKKPYPHSFEIKNLANKVITNVIISRDLTLHYLEPGIPYEKYGVFINDETDPATFSTERILGVLEIDLRRFPRYQAAETEKAGENDAQYPAYFQIDYDDIYSNRCRQYYCCFKYGKSIYMYKPCSERQLKEILLKRYAIDFPPPVYSKTANKKPM